MPKIIIITALIGSFELYVANSEHIIKMFAYRIDIMKYSAFVRMAKKHSQTFASFAI